MYVCAWVCAHVCVYLYLCSQVFLAPMEVRRGHQIPRGRVLSACESLIWILGNKLRPFCKNCKYYAIEPFPQPHKEYWTLLVPLTQLTPYVGAFRREKQSRVLGFWSCLILLTFYNYFVFVWAYSLFSCLSQSYRKALFCFEKLWKQICSLLVLKS